MVGLLICVAVACGVYYYIIRPYNFWTKQGIEQVDPKYIFGDLLKKSFNLESFIDLVQRIYKKTDKRYIGLYQMTQPVLLLRDPELIKEMIVKKFDHFSNHFNPIPRGLDPLSTENLFAMEDQAWRNSRATISPTFTGSKMKYLFALIQETSEDFVNFFFKKNEPILTLELRETYQRFTTDVIATSAFGVKYDSLRDPDNEFFELGRKLDFTGLIISAKFFGFVAFPRLMKFLKATFIDKDVGEFFKTIVKDAMEYREKNQLHRPDFLQLMVEARQNKIHNDNEEGETDNGTFSAQPEIKQIGKHVKMSYDEITSHAMFFFFGGKDTISGLLCFTSYELAVNPDIQRKLISEVDEKRASLRGKITYEELMKMKYLDMVLSESLRKWPIAVSTDRVVTKPFTIEPKYPEEKPVHLKTGDKVWIPIYPLQHDEQYFPDPEKFDPERFSEENRANLNRDAYMPFGIGPRHCIGFRFALMETKILFFNLLSKFEIVPVKQSQIPLTVSKKTFNFNTTAEGGFWFGFKRRNLDG